MMKILGVDFAPINIPLERRLQTIGAFIFLCSAIIVGPLCTALCFYTLFFTQYYWIVLIYACYRYFDGNPEKKGGRPKERMCRLAIWRYFRDYLPMKLIKTAKLDPSKNYLLAAFPHGFMAAGTALSFGTEALGVSKMFPGLRMTVTTADLVYQLAGMRELFLAHRFSSASKKSLNYLLSDPEGGRAAVVVVGGAAEALLCGPGNMHVVLKKRMGFIKMALTNGASLVPVISFGEHELYDQLPNPEGSWLREIQDRIKKIAGISPPLVCGRGFFQYTLGLLPRRRPVNVVVGKPMDVKKVINPSEMQIKELHQNFTIDLVNLFEENKHKYLKNADATFLVIH